MKDQIRLEKFRAFWLRFHSAKNFDCQLVKRRHVCAEWQVPGTTPASSLLLLSSSLEPTTTTATIPSSFFPTPSGSVPDQEKPDQSRAPRPPLTTWTSRRVTEISYR
ncbi:protein TPR2-like [Iris pallida]|uniref:Protein TPR2-like n=1 Tax=Iris pallida TaxID=29817 RepID=A0AAX6G2K1_IRIPA|nr:protein TPR2-like [Iris pallida]